MLGESNWDRASVVYCAPNIGCQGVLLWGWQGLSSRPNWLVCSFPPKGPELNLLVMASISWLDKIPHSSLPCSLSQQPFLAQELSFNFITQQGGSCRVRLLFVSVVTWTSTSASKKRITFKMLVVSVFFPASFAVFPFWHPKDSCLSKWVGNQLEPHWPWCILA